MKKFIITYTREFTFETSAISLEAAAAAAERMALAGKSHVIKVVSIYEDGKQPQPDKGVVGVTMPVKAEPAKIMGPKKQQIDYMPWEKDLA